MEINAKTEHWIETGTAVGTGVLAWEYEATKKYSQQVGYQGLFSKGRFEDALSGFVGSDTVRKIDPAYTGQGKAQFSLFGAINKTSLSGVAILIADSILKSAVPQYKSLDVFPSIIKGAGMGMTVGGIVGGMFDPNPSGYTAVSRDRPLLSGQGELMGGIATGNVPFSRAGTLAQLSVLQ